MPSGVRAMILGTHGVSTAGLVDIFDCAPSHSVGDPLDADARYQLASSGAGTGTGISGWTWLTSGLNSDYEVEADLVSGALTSGITGTGVWSGLGTTRTWVCQQTTIGTKTATLNLRIRRVSDGVVVGAATVTITADVS